MTLLTRDTTYPLLITRPDVLAAGYRDRQLTQLVRRGELTRIRPGAYVETPEWNRLDSSERHALTARAVLLHARTDVVLSHASALPEYGAPTWRVPLDEVHVTRRDRRAGRVEAGVHQHQGLLLEDDVVERNGVPVTSGTRLAIDITTLTSAEAALCVVNHLLHHGFTTSEKIDARYRRMRRNPHTLSANIVLGLADARMESVGETRTHFALWRGCAPAAEPQFKVRSAGGQVVARLDFAWPGRRTWLEFDGKEKYVKFLKPEESVSEVVIREKQREDMIREITGWRVLRITWADLKDPARLVRRLTALFS